MAKKQLIKKTVTTIPIDGLEDEREKDDSLDQDDMDIENVLRSIPGGVVNVKLYRIRSQGGRPKFLTELPPEMFSETYLQETYGGGIYLLRAKRKDGTWGRTTFEIDGPERQSVQPEIVEDEEEPITHKTEPVHQGIDPLMMVKMINDARREARQEFRDMLEILRPQMTPQPVAVQQNATEQVFSLVEKIVPLIAQGGGDGGSPWLMVLNNFREPLTKLVESLSMVAVRSGQQASPNNPVVTPVKPVSPQVQQKEDDMVTSLIKQYLPIFITAAAKNAEPESYADMVLDQVPESLYPKLLAWLNKPTCLEELAVIEPGIRFQQEWWISLRETLIVSLSGDSDNVNSGVHNTEAPTESIENS